MNFRCTSRGRCSQSSSATEGGLQHSSQCSEKDLRVPSGELLCRSTTAEDCGRHSGGGAIHRWRQSFSKAEKMSQGVKQNKAGKAWKKKRSGSLPGIVGLVTLLLLPLALPSHLLQFLTVLSLNEALLMSHLREVICSREAPSSQPGRGGGGECVKPISLICKRPFHHSHFKSLLF